MCKHLYIAFDIMYVWNGVTEIRNNRSVDFVDNFVENKALNSFAQIVKENDNLEFTDLCIPDELKKELVNGR